MKTNSLKPKMLLVFTILFAALASNAQQEAPPQLQHPILKKWLLPGCAMFTSGMLDGTIESITWHYQNGFKRALPFVHDQFWNPAISWSNKYKDGNQAYGERFMGSTTVFVCFTDAYHALRTARNFTDCLTLAFYIDHACRQYEKPKFMKILLDALILDAIRNIGFCATYSLAFREGSHF